MITSPAKPSIDRFLLEAELAVRSSLGLERDERVPVESPLADLGAEGVDLLDIIHKLGKSPGDYVMAGELTIYCKNLIRDKAEEYDREESPEYNHLMVLVKCSGRDIVKIITTKDIAEILRYEEGHNKNDKTRN